MKKYVQLYEALRQQIIDGAYAPGAQLPTEEALAQRYQVSRQTVRQALSLLRQGQYIHSVRGSGSFVAPPARRSATRRIAVITTYFSEYIFPSILRGISACATEQGYTVELNSTNNSISQERQILHRLMQGSLAGIIVEGTKTRLPNPNAEIYRSLAESGVPIVFINSIYDGLKGSNIASVVVDDYQGGYQLTKMLMADGVQQIGCISKTDDKQGYFRFSGMLDALLEQDFTFDDRNFLWFSTETKAALAETHTARWLLSECDALICYNDEIAELIVPLLTKESRITHLYSFDGNLNPQLIPPFIRFRSLRHPKEKLGVVATETLLQMIDGLPAASTVLPWDIDFAT